MQSSQDYCISHVTQANQTDKEPGLLLSFWSVSWAGCGPTQADHRRFQLLRMTITNVPRFSSQEWPALKAEKLMNSLLKSILCCTKEVKPTKWCLLPICRHPNPRLLVDPICCFEESLSCQCDGMSLREAHGNWFQAWEKMGLLVVLLLLDMLEILKNWCRNVVSALITRPMEEVS